MVLDYKVLGEFGEDRNEGNRPEMLVDIRNRFCFGIATISAIFQEAGHPCSAKPQFKMEVTGRAMMSAYSFRSQLGFSAGPAAFPGFRSARDDRTADSEMVSGVWPLG